MKVTLEDGPHAGVEMEADGHSPLLVQSGDDAEDMVARYRPTRQAGVYRFDSWDRIVMAVPWPPGAGE